MLSLSLRRTAGNKLRSFVQSFELAHGAWRRSSPFPLDISGAAMFSPSPSGKLLLVIKDSSGGQNASKESAGVIELWEAGGGLVDQISTAGVHGKIIGGSWFGGLSWSPDESKVVYVAQKKAEETRSFFAKPNSGKDASQSDRLGDQFLYEEDWGEKYEGVAHLGLYVADLAGSGKLAEIQGISELVTPGQPRFSPGGEHVVYTAWDCEPRKLGMIYCYQRPCNLYVAPLKALLSSMDDDSEDATNAAEEEKSPGQHACLCPGWQLARSPRFSPSGDRVVWLSREEGFDTHNGCFRLSSAPWDEKSGALAAAPRTLVDVVAVPEPKSAFPGLWVDDLPDACWTPDGSSIYLTSAWGSRQSVLRVDPETGTVARVLEATAAARQDPSTGTPEDTSASVLAVGNEGVYVVGSSPNHPGGFAVLTSDQDREWKAVSGPSVGGASITHLAGLHRDRLADYKRALSGVRWNIISVPIKNGAGEEELPFEAILLMPAAKSGDTSGDDDALPGRVPLIVVPHGGPHGVVPTAFVPAYAFLCATQGMAILHVNFRGSTGFGTAALESLPGRVGSQDVADVLAATKAALAEEPEALDPARLGIVGGSHGGFLGAHLSAQHPDLFRVTALRNPVTDIAAMVTISDIPDWCYVEALGRGNYDFSAFRVPKADHLQAMWKASPVAHVDNVVAPTLIALGAKDRRVPQSQGREWFHALRSKGVPTKLLVYPEDVHAIDKPASEADHWLNIASWLKEHLA